MWRRNIMMISIPKQPPLVEDLRNHSEEQIAELRQLLAVARLRGQIRAGLAFMKWKAFRARTTCLSIRQHESAAARRMGTRERSRSLLGGMHLSGGMILFSLHS